MKNAEPTVLVEPIPVYEVRVQFKDGDQGMVALRFNENAAQVYADNIKNNPDICGPLEIVDAFVVPQVVR